MEPSQPPSQTPPRRSRTRHRNVKTGLCMHGPDPSDASDPDVPSPPDPNDSNDSNDSSGTVLIVVLVIVAVLVAAYVLGSPGDVVPQTP